ncbi:ABC-2 family transporter protein [Gemella bergeri]|nr:ABC-2 family transporter protein [Gemella bergeri]
MLVYLLSYIIAFLLGYIVALLSTVFIRINGISELVNALLIIFGGGLLPLDLYPKLLLKISEVTPFYAIMYAPISIIVYDNDFGKILFILGIQIFWLITLLIVSKKLSQYVFKKFDIMGG